MKPENHAIRQLEKQLDGASPQVAVAIERVIAALNTVLLNSKDPDALALAKIALNDEMVGLEIAIDR